MKRLFSYRRFNAYLTVIWSLAIPLSYTVGWLNSVIFVSLVSLYANFASHMAAWRADVPIEPHEDVEFLTALHDKLNRFVDHELEKIEGEIENDSSR